MVQLCLVSQVWDDIPRVRITCLNLFMPRRCRVVHEAHRWSQPVFTLLQLTVWCRTVNITLNFRLANDDLRQIADLKHTKKMFWVVLAIIKFPSEIDVRSFFYSVCITGIITLIFFNNIIIRGLMQKSLSFLNNVIPILYHGIADIVTSKKNSTLNVETKSIFLRWWKLMTMTCWCVLCHDDVIKWKHFPHYWPFVWGIHRSPVNSQHKGHWRGALMFSLICVWINGWVNNREAGDLRRYRPIMTSP